MEPGQSQLQIFVSLVIILAAALVALICDFLRAHNEQLRELTIELKVRHEEELKRARLLTHRPFAKVAVQRTIGSKEQAALAPGNPKRVVAAEAMAAMQRGAAMASAPQRPNTVPDGMIEFRAAATAEHSTDTAVIKKSSIERGVQEKAVQRKPPTRAIEALSAGAARHRTNWGDLLARRSQMSREVAAQAQVPQDAVAAETSRKNESKIENSPGIAVPVGFHDARDLDRLLANGGEVSGLVVSIGVSATNIGVKGAAAGDFYCAPVRSLIQSLLGPQDFGCAPAPDEYLLIFPEECGASAQRCLNAISQKLWDFQLQALGAASVLFSWGGVEVHGESLEEAMASARERMLETRRSRAAKSIDNRRLKIAV